MDAFVWRLWPVQSRRVILIYLDLRQPYRNLRRRRRHLGSGLNGLDLWTTTIELTSNSRFAELLYKFIKLDTKEKRLPVYITPFLTLKRCEIIELHLTHTCLSGLHKYKLGILENKGDIPRFRNSGNS